ncbi:helix-turn-helix transcriptional regulator [Rhizobium sp. S163]|uniref:helix-turn-helix domain-containing protein n=1 Tax=Rhizobium sp. S163 TaxID=3055039 RepID=UPI00339D8BF5
MSFRFDVGARARSASRLIGNIRSDIIAAVVRHRTAENVSQQRLAESIGISRADLNSYLSGQKDLTLRSLADIAFALNKEIVVELRDPESGSKGNYFDEPSLVPTARKMERYETVTRTTSRSMRIFRASASADQDD